MKSIFVGLGIVACIVLCYMVATNHFLHGHGDHHDDAIPEGYHKMDDGTLMKTTSDHESSDATTVSTVKESVVMHTQTTLLESPVTIEGEAVGNWFFEGSFPINIVDWDGKIIGEGIAQATGEWMTTEHVPFTATITFEKPAYKNTGAIIFKKDNPSGLPIHDGAVEIPVTFAE